MSDIEKVERIERIIREAEIEEAKNKGVIESITSGWKEKYGTDNVSDIEKRLLEIDEKISDLKERIAKNMSKLEKACDWERLEGEVC